MMADHGDRQKTKPTDRWVILGGVWLVYVCFGAVTASLAPLVAEVRGDLLIGVPTMGLIMGAWPFVYALTALPCGVLLDRVGAGPCIALAICAILISAVARGLAVGPISLILATAVLGVGGPLISIGAPKLVSAFFEDRQRGLAMGLYITGPSLGAVLAILLTHPVLLPLVGDWRGVMWVYAAATAISALVWWIITKTTALPRPAASAVPVPVIPGVLRLLRTNGVPAILLIAAALFFVNHTLNNWLVEILRVRGDTPEQAGLRASLPTLVGLVAAPILPALVPQRYRGHTLAVLLALTVAGTLLMLAPSDTALTLGLVLQGLMRGTVMTFAMLMMLDLPGVGGADRGTIGGLFFTAGEIGGVLGPVTFGILAASDPDFGSPLLLVAAVAALAIPIVWSRQRRAA